MACDRADLRATLTMAALVGTRHDPVLKRFYERPVATGRPKKPALVAFTRKLPTILNGMTRSITPWQTA